MMNTPVMNTAMMNTPIIDRGTKNKKINIGIVAHVDAGKTTITEQFLYKSGVIKTIGRVDTGDTVTDSLEVEKSHGITVKTSTVSFDWQGVKINLLDTPGHMDFIAEVERSLSVLDGAILAISAKEGVQIQTRIIFEALRRLNIPTVLFVNKVDRMGVDLNLVYEDIRQILSEEIVLINEVTETGSRTFDLISYAESPSLQKQMAEFASLHDESLFDRWANGEEISILEMESVLSKAYLNSRVFPVLHGSALHGMGIEELLTLVSKWLIPQETSALFAKVYKVDRSRGQRRCFVRLYGGELRVRGTYLVKGWENPLKVAQLGALKGGKVEQTGIISAGDAGIIYSNELKIEDCIFQENDLEISQYKAETIASPMLKSVIVYENIAQRKAILEALEQLTDEDPFLDFGINSLTEEIEVKLFGTVQKEILEIILRDRFELEVSINEPVTLLKEMPVGSAEHMIHIFRDGNPYSAGIGLRIEPNEVNGGFKYETKVSFGDLKKPFQNAVEDGVRKSLDQGLSGYHLTDLKVTFVASEFNSVDSTPSDYRKLASVVMRMALEKCGTKLLEPLLKFELKVPETAVGRAISDILRMRGEVGEPKCIKGEYYLDGIVPVDSSKQYLMELLDYTEGRGVFITSFHGYREL